MPSNPSDTQILTGVRVERGGVPVAWLVAALWLVTVGLAGAWASSVQRQLGDISQKLDRHIDYHLQKGERP